MRTARAQNAIEQTGNPYGEQRYTTTMLAAFTAGRRHQFHRRDLPAEPNNWKDIASHQFKDEFTEAAAKEWQQVLGKNTVQIVDLQEATTKPLPLRWVFKYKFDKHGYLQSFKARICVRGDLQPDSGRDTYAATLANRTFRTIIALATRWDLHLKQLDAVNAFPNAELDETVYIQLPDGFKAKGKIGRLLRALYGLRISPLLW
jgi:hypothetical protein